MVRNIKNVWKALDLKTRKAIMPTILKEMKLESEQSFITNYIYRGMILEERQPQLLKILQNALREQHKNQEKELLA